jgi:hypothetical protein
MTCLFGLQLDSTRNPVRGIHVAWVGYCLDVSVKQIEEVSPPYHPRIQFSELGPEVLPENDHPRVNVLLLSEGPGMASLVR